jgi:hypothetical protein
VDRAGGAGGGGCGRVVLMKSPNQLDS